MKIVAVHAAVSSAPPTFYVFCDNGTVFRWVPPETRHNFGGLAWDELDPPMPRPADQGPVDPVGP